MKNRLLSSAILIGFVVTCVFADSLLRSDLPSCLLLALFLIGGCLEFHALTLRSNNRLFITTLLVFTPIFLLLTRVDILHGWRYAAIAGSLVFFAVLILQQCAKKDPRHGTINLSLTVFAFIYIVVLGSFLYRIRLENDGLFLVIYLIATAKITDTGALLSGMFFGRHALIPWISPAKTVEGLIGGLLAATLFAFVCNQYGGKFLSAGQALSFGLIIGVAATAGDLFESMIKRDAGVKDSGQLAPGLGGVLDIIDSLLLSAPVGYFFIVVARGGLLPY